MDKAGKKSKGTAGMGAAGKKTKVAADKKLNVEDPINVESPGEVELKGKKDKDKDKDKDEEDKDEEDTDEEEDEYFDPSSIAVEMHPTEKGKGNLCSLDLYVPRVMCAPNRSKKIVVQGVVYKDGGWTDATAESKLPIQLNAGALYKLSVDMIGDSETPTSKSGYYPHDMPVVAGMDFNSVQVIIPCLATVSLLKWTLKEFTESTWSFISDGELKFPQPTKKTTKRLAISFDLLTSSA